MRSLTLVLLFWSCFLLRAFPTPQAEPIIVDGQTMGTTWKVVYFDEQRRNFQSSLDSLLQEVNRSINYYDPASEVSRFNKSKNGITVTTKFLIPPIKKGLEVFAASEGTFDMTVLPLVNAWGFGPGQTVSTEVGKIDSIRKFVGFRNVRIADAWLSKSDPRIQLDFGGIGQGYAVDVITGFLKKKGIKHFVVDVGGEGYASGNHIGEKRAWQIGVLDPGSTVENQFFKTYLSVKDKAFSTSGNYFNYRIVDGRKFGHTLDPRTGFPVTNEMLGITVIANDCISADAWATAFMVHGLTKSVELLNRQPSLEAIIFYSTTDGSVRTYMTEGIKSMVIPQAKHE
jgi:FAD:protein FMN transferase